MAETSPSTISENATKPADATVDGTRVRAHPLKDQIAADQYARSQTAASKKGFGIRLANLKSPGPQ